MPVRLEGTLLVVSMVPKNPRQLRGEIDSRFDSHRAFAAEVGCSPPHISRVLNGQRGVAEDMARAWAKALNRAHQTTRFTPDAMFERTVVSARTRSRKRRPTSTGAARTLGHAVGKVA